MGDVVSSNVISRAGSGARCVGTDAQAASNAASEMGTNERRSVITTSAKGQIIDNARRAIEWLGPGKYSLTASLFGVVGASRSFLLVSAREGSAARSAAIRRESHSRNRRHRPCKTRVYTDEWTHTQLPIFRCDKRIGTWVPQLR